MKGITQTWLHEGQIDLDAIGKHFTDAGSMTAARCATFCLAVERVLKAPIVEKQGSIPKGLQTHDLTEVADSIGLSAFLPQSHQVLLRALTSFGPETRYPGTNQYTTLVNSTSAAQWRQLITDARHFKEFMETKVLPDANIMSQLTIP